MADLVLKRGDTYPPLTVTLSDASGAIDLTLASAVHMEMKANSGTIQASLGMTIASPAGGLCKHTWAVAETGMPVDTWSTEWEILWANGGIQTVPNDGQKSIQFIADIEGT